MKIRYIGKKPVKTDNVAHSGTVWNGPGDVQDVTDAVAIALLAHPGVWESADDRIPEPEESVEPLDDEDERPRIAALPNLDAMTKDELDAYAMQEFQTNLDRRKSKDALVHQIRSLMNAR